MKDLSPIQKKFLYTILKNLPFSECLHDIERLIADGLRDPRVNSSEPLYSLQTRVEDMGTLQKRYFLEGLFSEWGWPID